MRIRHIVMWKLADPSAENIEEIRVVLEGLNDSIDEVESLVVRPNVIANGTNYDLVLDSVFADETALARYATHPDHVAAVAVVKKHAVERAAADFEF